MSPGASARESASMMMIGRAGKKARGGGWSRRITAAIGIVQRLWIFLFFRSVAIAPSAKMPSAILSADSVDSFLS